MSITSYEPAGVPSNPDWGALIAALPRFPDTNQYTPEVEQALEARHKLEEQVHMFTWAGNRFQPYDLQLLAANGFVHSTLKAIPDITDSEIDAIQQGAEGPFSFEVWETILSHRTTYVAIANIVNEIRRDPNIALSSIFTLGNRLVAPGSLTNTTNLNEVNLMLHVGGTRRLMYATAIGLDGKYMEKAVTLEHEVHPPSRDEQDPEFWAIDSRRLKEYPELLLKYARLSADNLLAGLVSYTDDELSDSYKQETLAVVTSLHAERYGYLTDMYNAVNWVTREEGSEPTMLTARQFTESVTPEEVISKLISVEVEQKEYFIDSINYLTQKNVHIPFNTY